MIEPMERVKCPECREMVISISEHVCSDDPRERLDYRMEEIRVDPSLIDAVYELAYTAMQSGRMDIRVAGDEEAADIVRLVHLAKEFARQGGVPEDLRM